MKSIDVFYVVLSIVSVLVSGVLIPYIKRKYKSQDIEYVMSIVNIAVSAAEQIFKQSGMGKEKKAYVLKYLNDRGIKVSEAELDAMIEASVLELNKWKKEVEASQNVNVINKDE